MAKQSLRASKAASKKPPQAPIQLFYLFLLLAYGFVTLFTPNLKSLDSNGPKFLAFALLNLLAFVLLFTRKDIRSRPEWYYAFFRNGIGLSYTGLMIVSLLSFSKAINVTESVLHFAKIFTTFTASYLLAIIIMADRRNIKYLSIAMSLLLIYDSITVFLELGKYIHSEFSSINEIRTDYSNKNILAASIFVKIPFTLWLLVFERKWLQAVGVLGTFIAILTTMVLSTRAFYLGLLALTIILAIYFVYRYFHTHEKFQLKLLGTWLILLFSAYISFWALQRYIYPQTQDAKERSVAARIASITDPDGGGRLGGWKRSWHVFTNSPLTGVGLGNWKVVTLKEENLTNTDFTYHYKAHNDFIEITTETGIFGGILFVALFIFLWLGYLKVLKNKPGEDWQSWFFIPAAGLFCYSIDAFFNFPQDRPEIQSIFALYIGMGIAIPALLANESSKPIVNHIPGKALPEDRLFTHLSIPSTSGQHGTQSHTIQYSALLIAFPLLITASVYILILNFYSLKLQRIVQTEITRGILTSPASLFVNGFPDIPNLNSVGEPIAVNKARYLINEGQYEKAIEILKNDNSSPYDARKEYFLAMAYAKLNISDSAIAYCRKVYGLKPNHTKNVLLLCNLLKLKGEQNQSETILDKYLISNKVNKEAWIFASGFYEKSGNMLKAVTIMDTAAKYFPDDTMVIKQKSVLDRKAVIVLNKVLYDKASSAFNEKKYRDAAGYYSELLSIAPGFAEARNFRAYSYYFLKEYTKSNLDLDILISGGESRSALFNLRGVNFNNLGNKDEACNNFKIAAGMGDKDGLNNYARFCQPVKK
jgi:putative inorganic carbon (hco3(-)) transporter